MNQVAAHATERNANFAFRTGLTSALAALTFVLLFATDGSEELMLVSSGVPLACSLIGPRHAALALHGGRQHQAKAVAGDLLSLSGPAALGALGYWWLSSVDGIPF